MSAPYILAFGKKSFQTFNEAPGENFLSDVLSPIPHSKTNFIFLYYKN